MKRHLLIENQSTYVKGIDGPDKEYLYLVIDKLRQLLGISEGRKIIINTNQKAHLFGTNHNGSTIISNETIVIFLNENIINDQILKSLAHEMVHAQHLDSGMMDMNISDLSNILLKWKGKTVPTNYSRSSEWEVDAHIKERPLLHGLLADKDIINMRENLLTN